MSQQGMDQLRGELRQRIAGRLGWTPNEEKAAAWHEAVEAALDVAVPIEASRRDWAAEADRLADAVDLAEELIGYVPDYFREKWKFEQLEAMAPTIVRTAKPSPIPCSCLTPDGAAVVLAGGFSLPLCAVHPGVSHPDLAFDPVQRMSVQEVPADRTGPLVGIEADGAESRAVHPEADR